MSAGESAPGKVALKSNKSGCGNKQYTFKGKPISTTYLSQHHCNPHCTQIKFTKEIPHKYKEEQKITGRWHFEPFNPFCWRYDKEI